MLSDIINKLKSYIQKPSPAPDIPVRSTVDLRTGPLVYSDLTMDEIGALVGIMLVSIPENAYRDPEELKKVRASFCKAWWPDRELTPETLAQFDLQWNFQCYEMSAAVKPIAYNYARNVAALHLGNPRFSSSEGFEVAGREEPWLEAATKPQPCALVDFIDFMDAKKGIKHPCQVDNTMVGQFINKLMP